ncbi:MAG TPA: 4Fe-4S binding protein [Streptosporangiaceae bacterium]|nr:4Fe-4S binding protein [Streptosporangiaceae bacterium]
MAVLAPTPPPRPTLAPTPPPRPTLAPTPPPRPSTVTIGACQGCGACLLTCPEHAIRPAGGTLVVLAQRCTGCGECIEVCPVDAITETQPAPGGPGTTVPAGRTARWPA